MSPEKENEGQSLSKAYELLLKNEQLLSFAGMNWGRSRIGWVNELSMHGLKLLVDGAGIEEEKRKELLLKIALTLEIGVLISKEGGPWDNWENSLVAQPIIEALGIIRPFISEDEINKQLKPLKEKEAYSNFLYDFRYELRELKQEGAL